MKKLLLTTLHFLLLTAVSMAQTSIHGRIIVSENKRFLQYEDGTPFFYLGETAWELFHRCSREEADLYLRNRAQKGYTVIQAVALAEIDGLNTPNVYGDIPLFTNNPEKPNEAYFKHVDFIIDLAASYGLVIGFLPTWGDKVAKKNPEFNEANALIYGKYLGERYKDKKNIIWILGGDRDWNGFENVWEAMAKGIAIGTCGSEDYSKVTMTLHPSGGNSSSRWFHNDAWLDFNMQQNGHCYTTDTWNHISADYNRIPVKPTVDGEPLYEEHPICFDPTKNGTSNDYHCRRYLYHDLFAGAMGHTYGCHAIWQMYTYERAPINHPLRSWIESLNLPGAFEMQHARYLIESRPFFTRIPDSTLLLSPTGTGNQHISATRDSEGSYAFIYSENGNKFTVDLNKLSGSALNAFWFDPRTGKAILFDTFNKTAFREFTPPTSGPGNDWILVLDDVSKRYPLPGISKTEVDFIPPSSPQKVTVIETSPGSAIIRWEASTDNTKVLGYQVFIKNKLVGATAENFIRISGLIPETEYTVDINSIDAGFNFSTSNSVFFKTQKDKPVKSIVISGLYKDMKIGKPQFLTATTLPANDESNSLTWVSENPDIAFVDKNGIVVPVKPGKASIYAKSKTGIISNKLIINVLIPEDLYFAKYITGKIAVDGTLSEKDWKGMTKTTRVIEGKNDNTLSFKILWDSTYIYVGAIVADTNIYSNLNTVWENDAIELYFDGNCNKGSGYDTYDRQFILPANGNVYESRNYVLGTISKTIQSTTGYTLEFAIPWSSLNIKPQAKNLIGFDISNIDNDNGLNRSGLIMWKGTSSNWMGTENFGTVAFEK